MRLKQSFVRLFSILLLTCGSCLLLPLFIEAAGTIDRDWWREAAKPYRGTVLRGVTENTPSSVYVEKVLTKRFTELTGIEVMLEEASWDDMYYRSIRDMATSSGIYDFLFIEQDIVYAYNAQTYLVSISDLLTGFYELKCPDFDFANFNSYLRYFTDETTGSILGVPMEAFIKAYVYRKDLFDNVVIRKAFQEEYGYELKPAGTYKEYVDISRFFTDWGRSHDLKLWGTTFQASVDHPASFYEFFETILPTFGVYNWGINIKTMRADIAGGGTMNSSAAKKAFKTWLELLKYCSPETIGSTWEEAALTFASGRTAHQYIYAENLVWLATDSKRSKVVDKIGVALPPLEPGVLEAAKDGHGYIGYYDGGAFGIPRSSQNKEAAFLWLQFIGLPAVQTEWTLHTGRVVQNSTLDNPAVIVQDEKIGGYYSFLKKYGNLYAGAPAYPFHAAVREIVAPFIYAVLRGQMEPSPALDLAAEKVDAFLGRVRKTP